jgi:hypothetical protein
MDDVKYRGKRVSRRDFEAAQDVGSDDESDVEGAQEFTFDSDEFGNEEDEDDFGSDQDEESDEELEDRSEDEKESQLQDDSEEVNQELRRLHNEEKKQPSKRSSVNDRDKGEHVRNQLVSSTTFI